MGSYGYQAVLELEGENPIILDHCSYSYVRDINEKTGIVQSGVLDGTISLLYIDHPTKAILEWAMKYKMKNGNIKVSQSDSNVGKFVLAEEVKLTEAACVMFDLNYNRNGSSHFSTRLAITSNVSQVGKADKVSKKWNLV